MVEVALSGIVCSAFAYGWIRERVATRQAICLASAAKTESDALREVLAHLGYDVVIETATNEHNLTVNVHVIVKNPDGIQPPMH